MLKATLIGLCALTRGTAAENGGMIAPSPEFAVTPPAFQQSQTNVMDVFASVTVPEHQPFQAGPFIFRPHPFYRYLYADGILAAPTNAVSTSIQTFSPGFQMDLGVHWTLDYTPTWTVYSSRSFRDTLDQSVKLAGWATRDNWTLGMSQGYVSSSAPLVETGTQTDQEIYATAINASYLINSRMSLDLAANQNLTYAAQLDSFREWSTLDWLNYQFWPRLSIALGAGFGYVNVETGANMTYEQLQGRVQWRATDKISFQLNGGLEDRQFLISGASDALNPVAGAAIQYQPFEHTQLSVNASRSTSASLLTTSGTQNQFTENTAVTGGLNQRLLGHFFLGLSGGYNTSKYVASSGSSGREDDYYSFAARLSTTFLKRGNIAVFYQWSDNSSSPAQSGFSYTSRQVGIEVGFRY